VIHSRKEQRYRCKRCSQTFSATKGTALYRLHKPRELVVTVVTLLAYGCPPQAIVGPSISMNAPSLAGSTKAVGSADASTNASRPGRRGALGARPGR
jgi:hypothetical protein